MPTSRRLFVGTAICALAFGAVDAEASRLRLRIAGKGGVVTPTPTPTPIGQPVALYAGPTWNGTATSGGTPPDDIPSNETRGKPCLKVLSNSEMSAVTPDGSNRYLMVEAFAVGGVQKVIAWCEGRSVEETVMRSWTYLGEDGVSRNFWGYVFDMAHANWTQNGAADVYLYAVPNDPTFDTRRLGPTRVYRDSSEWKQTLTVNTAQANSTTNFQTVATALAAANAAIAAQGGGSVYWPVRIRKISGGDEAMTAPSTTRNVAGVQCWIDLINESGGDVRCYGPGGSSTDIVRMRTNGLRWRGSWVFDRESFFQIYFNETNINPQWTAWLGVRITGTDRFRLRDGRSGGIMTNPPATNQLDNNRLILSEVVMTEVPGGVAAYRSRNLTINGTASDTTSNTMHTHNLRVNGADSSGLRQRVPLGTVTYNGTGAIATFAKTGTNSEAGTVVLTVDGVTTTIQLSTTPVTGIYWAEDLAAAINAQPGWSTNIATPVSPYPGLRIGYLTNINASGFAAFTTPNLKGASAYALYVGIDLHVDGLWQHSTPGLPNENILHVNGRGINLEADVQAAQISSNGLRDTLFINTITSHVSDSSNNFNFGKSGGNPAWSAASKVYTASTTSSPNQVYRSGFIYKPVVTHTSDAGNGPPGANWEMVRSATGVGNTFFNVAILNATMTRQGIVQNGNQNKVVVRNSTFYRNVVDSGLEGWNASIYDHVVHRMFQGVGGSSTPPGSTNVYFNYTLAQMFTDGGGNGSNFVPNPDGPLVLYANTPDVPFDNNNNARGPVSALGAVRSLAEAALMG